MIKKLLLFIISLIKIFILKLRFGKNLEINTIKQHLRFDTEIYVGKDSNLRLNGISTQTNVHIVCVQGNLEIGHKVSFNRNCIVISRQKISIGNNCSFGPNVCIYDHDHAFHANGVIPNKFKCTDVIIEDGCWIGAGSIVLRGTHIGKNSVIGAGTIIQGNIPPNSLVVSKRENNIVEIR